MIGVKIEDKMYLFDYAGSGGYHGFFIPNLCKVNGMQNFDYELKFGSHVIQDVDLEAIYLGPIKKSLTQNNPDILMTIMKFVFDDSGYDDTLYSLRYRNCRHFSHELAIFLGVEAEY